MKKIYGSGSIVDFEVNGNIVRYLVSCDTHYIEQGFVSEVKTSTLVEKKTYYYDYDWVIVFACNGLKNSGNLKDDLINKKIPCVIVVKNELANNKNNSFDYWLDFYNDIFNIDEIRQNNIEAFFIGDHLLIGDTLETRNSGITFPYLIGK